MDEDDGMTRPMSSDEWTAEDEERYEAEGIAEFKAAPVEVKIWWWTARFENGSLDPEQLVEFEAEPLEVKEGVRREQRLRRCQAVLLQIYGTVYKSNAVA